MKRSLLIMTMMTASLAFSAWDGYEEVRELNLAARGIDTLKVDAGSGRLDIVGVEGAREIAVVATIQVEDENEDEARKFIESDLVLTLDQASDVAVLKAYFDRNFWGSHRNAAVQLEVRVPTGMHLDIEDGSGSINIGNVRGDIHVEDGSGSIEMNEVGGNIKVNDGSGGISIVGVNGDVTIDDGSGSIKVRSVSGSVVVDDGSGGIDVSDVGADLVIVDDGSGSLRYDNIAGQVQNDS